VLNGDVWTDVDWAALRECSRRRICHLVLVANRPQPSGDFVLERGRIVETPGERFTFSGVGVYARSSSTVAATASSSLRLCCALRPARAA